MANRWGDSGNSDKLCLGAPKSLQMVTAAMKQLQDLLELTPKKYVIFIIGDWNAKVGTQEIFGITGKYDVGVQNEARQRLTILFREHTGQSKHPFSTTHEMTLHMDITRRTILKLD